MVCRTLRLLASAAVMTVVFLPEMPPLRADDLLDAAGAIPTFTDDVGPILDAKCVHCHGDEGRKGELDLRTLTGLLAGGESGAVVAPGSADESLLITKVVEGEMPPDGDDENRLTNEELSTIRQWVEHGIQRDIGSQRSAAETAQTSRSFHSIWPILLRRCTVCHGARVQEAGLDLHTYQGLMRGGKSGPCIAPGDAEQSLLLRKILAAQMPPIDRLVDVSVKPLERWEIEAIQAWILAGAIEGDDQPDIAGTAPDPLVSDADRLFWAFRPPRKSAPPTVGTPDKVRSPIDAFVLAKLEENGLTFSPAADRATLIRRLTFDLWGIPPAPDDVAAFIADRDPQAYEKLVERLLASPHYAARWARHWLDVVGYADSDGKREQDLERRSAWRYRDYVIRAFQSDKPYDRFLLEQLAGDELADYRNADPITPEIYDNLVATGFMRMAPDGTWRNITNFVPDRLDVMADQIDILGSAVLGLTLKCARCHSHKFDPLPQRDYYRLVAIFKGAFDEHDWLKGNWHEDLSQGQQHLRELPIALAVERQAWKAKLAHHQRPIAELNQQLAQRVATITDRVRAEKLATIPLEVRAAVVAMLNTTPSSRTKSQRELAERYGQLQTVEPDELRRADADFAEFEKSIKKRIGELERSAPPEPSIRALWDRGDPSPTYIYRRGDYLQPGRLVGPGVPSVLTDGQTPFDVKPPWRGAVSTGRRLAFARWLIRPDHPLTARVIVNRIWSHHFGAGIVRTLDNFGKTGTPPSHPELLDWLAVDFIEHGWSIQRLHRMMVTSTTYRQSSKSPRDATDLHTILLARMPLRRLSSDQLYDGLLSVADALDPRIGGAPDGVVSRPDGLVTPLQSRPQGWRRSIFVQQQRKIVVSHFEAFDFPAMNPNCCQRSEATVPLQALHLWNDGLVEQLAERFAARVWQSSPTDRKARVRDTYQIAFGRVPTDAEIDAGALALERLVKSWELHTATQELEKPIEAERLALHTWCHALINSAEFLYVD